MLSFNLLASIQAKHTFTEMLVLWMSIFTSTLKIIFLMQGKLSHQQPFQIHPNIKVQLVMLWLVTVFFKEIWIKCKLLN